MLKYATFIVPMLLRLGNTSSSAKDVQSQIGVLALMSVAITFFLAAVFTWVAKTYSLDIAFLVIALILAAAAIVLSLKRRIAKASALQDTIDRDAKLKGVLAAKADPLSEYIPDEILTHPVVQKVLAQIEDRPFLAALVAVVLGMIVSNQLLDNSE
ncbi:hypothetical protein GCM10009069_19610 [Algimonas arctica]|uniref:Uncharacterized protein n=1 Tax=Algimonas arctica TaxID=1479486 RepID=A0A8J3G2P6_9PROT|nr:hypothetical protein [Algimonas arctica]GHA96654.1 hypothetical protein GCM10009069_19610 [Algimonas arctica]